MSLFELKGPNQEAIQLVNELPSIIQSSRLTGAVPISAQGDFGQMVFQHFAGEGFDIWYSQYFMRQSVTLSGSSDQAVLELHIPLVNVFDVWCEGMVTGTRHCRQLELSYLPYVNTRASFAAGQSYQCFDIHFRRELLLPYSIHCPKMAELLERSEQGKASNMLDMVHFISPEMYRIVRAMLEYRFDEALAGSYFTALVHELLSLVTIQVAGLSNGPLLPAADLQKAREAHALILKDFEVYDSVEKLARKVATTEMRLQTAFKQLYGSTVFLFSRSARLAAAYKLLQETNYPLRVICVMVGYPDPGNFSVAFRKEYGCWPGKVVRGTEV